MNTSVIPLNRHRPLADIVERARDADRLAFLDSSMPGTQGRYSILGLFPYLIIKQKHGACLVNGKPAKSSFFDVVKEHLQADAGTKDPRLPLTGGAIGYLGYDFGRELCGVPTVHERNSEMPEASMVFYDLLIIEDLRKQALFCCCKGKTMTADEAAAWADDLIARCPCVSRPARKNSLAPFASAFTRESYEDTLARLVEYLHAGDAYVVNMTQQLSLETSEDPYSIYRYLRTYNPAPFSAYLRAPGLDICCSSMERFMEIRSGMRSRAR